jgi:4-amino-4-deoxy-L-arabinose transferase-like glycosyltransferase
MYLTGGPLSQHYHALLFCLFGPSFLAVVISNLLIGLGLLILIYRLFLANSDARTATTICVGVALVFACNQYSNIGNFNFITPYCHEVWHGLFLSIVAVALLSKWLNECKNRFAAAAGICLGLVFMTKPEVFAALMLALAATLLIVGRDRGLLPALKGAGWMLAAASIPLAAFAIWFHRVENWHDSFRSVGFAWVPLLNSSVSQQFFYKWCLGLDAPKFHLRMMLLHLLVLAGIIGGLALLLRQKLNTSAKRLSAFGAFALLLALATGFDWVDCGRSLPVLCLAACFILGASLLSRLKRTERGVHAASAEPLNSASEFSYAQLNNRTVKRRERRAPALFPFLWSIFAFALLAKLGLYSRIWHYGFTLAMPAFVTAIFLLLWLLPFWLQKFRVDRRLFRLAVTALLTVGFLRLFVQSQQSYATKSVPVGRGHDLILAQSQKSGPSADAVRTALDWLNKNAAPDASLAVLPEGVMLNYLSRRVNPTRYLVWNPAEIASFGQAAMTDAFRSHPPDYVMLVHRDASEYGAAFFGQQQSFGGELLQWITANYQPVCLIGDEPLRNSLFGIKILKRSSARSDPL